MIKIENTEVYGFEAAIRGARNPYDSWDKSDSCLCDGRSSICDNCYMKPEDDYAPCYFGNTNKGRLYVVGAEDMKLLKKLAKAGDVHGKALRMINVTCDITAPLYWWKEADTYKVGTVRNSCSTMHTITNKEFTLDDFSHEYAGDFEIMSDIVKHLNQLRLLYLRSQDKAYWYAIIQILPSSYNQRSTWQANYQVLRHMYHARKNHKLNEWIEFCRWIETLPYGKELICDLE
jgi:hypothetical protein